ncbi:alpha-protein kinase 3 isoform X2 [Hemicordylus capensis]|uniref:alpha-protein kinase 3 isoform X2 n=1 Tax=Hemicordylus capensis TaxID=884348 RepID=UPI002303A474|nr:alpha-protein kinase 3 isoform X2 [Hemicordylus capensis]
MGSRRRPLGRSYSGTGRYSAYSPGQSSDGEDNNGPLVESRPERRSYLLSVRPENRSTFCTIIAQLTEETQPLFETTLRSYAVSEDADAKFTCIVTGYPQPEVTWYKDDEEMDRYCGLPKYEIFRHGNRHTLQLYRCREEDAAIYQASARNSKGIVSCSGVLEVGTMTEYKIHQRWFAKLKRKAEAKLREIEQSRKRGKENMEMEQLRRVSPDRFQRKRRLTGEVGMRSGASLWDKEEVAKVHIPDGKPRFSEDDRAKGKGPPIHAATLFSNNFITGRLEAEVSTNGDSSLESGEENGEENTNGFLTYIYETVESIKNKPVTKEFSAKKKKKEEETTALPNANQDIFQREGGTQQRRNTVTQRDVRPSENTPSLATNGEQMEAESKDLPSWVTEKHTPLPYSTPSNADVYFSLKDMYFDIRAKPEVEQKSSEEKASRADMCPPGVDVPRWEETPPAANVALERLKPEEVPNEPSAEEEAKDKDAGETQNNQTAPERAGGLNVTSFQCHNWSTAPTAEGQPSLWTGDTAEISDNSISRADAQPPSWAAETDVGAKEKAMLYANLRETDLLDSLPTDDAEPDLQPQTLPRSAASEPCVDSSLHMQKAAGEQPPPSLGEPEGPCEAPETLQPAESAVHNISHSPDSALREENKQETGYLTIRESAPVETGDEWSKKRDSPSPETQESRMVVVSQENNQYTSVTSQNPPAVSLSGIQPTGQDNLVLTEDVGRLSPSFERDEIQHRKAPSPERKELVTPGSPAQRADLESRPSDRLDRGVPQTEPVIGEKQEQTSELLRDNSLDLKMDLGLEAERTPVVTARPLLLPEVAVGTPVPYQNALEKPHPVPTVVVPQARHESQGPPAVLSPVSEGLAERNQSVAHLLKDVKREMDARLPVNGFSVEKGQAKEGSLSPLMGEENGQRGLILGKEVGAKERGRTAPVQDLPQPETAMEEEKAQNANLVSSLKNYLLLLLKMTTETDKSKGSPKQEVKAVEERSPLSAIPRHLPEVGIAGLTPRTSRKIFERVETDQLFQSAESLQLTPKTSRKITGMINRELLACQESLGAEPEAPPLPCVPSIVVGSAPGEAVGLPDLSPGSPSEAPAALPSATPQELASGARRKIYLPKSKPSDEMEGAVPDGQERPQRESPTVSPQQSRKNVSLLQTPSPASSPPVERRSPTLARKMATLEVPKIYEEPTEESKDVADGSHGALEGLEKTGPEGQTGESRKANDPFKAPQVIRKIRAEQFSDASGNLKLWCQFFNILSDSKLTWYKDEIPVTDVRRSSGDEGQAALAIVQVSLKDCGVYQCTIQNEYGTDSTDFLLSAEVLSGFISKEEIEVGEEIEMTPMVFAKGLADSGFWGDKLFGRIMMEDLEVGPGFLRKACRARAIYGLEPVFESGHTGIIKVRNLIAFGGRSESTLVERNYDITIQECKIQNSSREYCKIFAAEARAIPAFGAVPEIIPLYLIYRPANNIPYATMEEDLPGKFERYCGRARDSSSLAPASASEVGHKCCTFQHWLYQWTNGNILVTDLEGVGWKITNVRIATKAKGYQGLKESFCPNLLEHFAASHQCNRYCELLALKSLEVPQPPPRSKGSRSPITGRKAPSAQSSPQLPKKGLASPQAPRKGSVSPKSARKCPETQEAARPQAGDSGKASRRP